MDNMTISQDWFPVLAAQKNDGAFLSYVHLKTGAIEDWNGFATALILDCLQKAENTPEINVARERAIGFLENCESLAQPGQFGFYPRGEQPKWMVPKLPDDADDTALFNLALLRAGRIEQVKAQRVITDILHPFRLTYLSERSEPWHQIGVFETWIDSASFRNPVDCTVNTNVLTLLHASGGNWPETTAITKMLYAAVDWAGTFRARAGRLSPWYPNPIEFVHALDRAAAVGVPQIDALVARLHCLDWVRKDIERDLPICGSSDRRIVWTCSALTRARANLRCRV